MNIVFYIYPVLQVHLQSKRGRRAFKIRTSRVHGVPVGQFFRCRICDFACEHGELGLSDTESNLRQYRLRQLPIVATLAEHVPRRQPAFF